MKKQVKHFLNLNIGLAIVFIISLFATQTLIGQTVIWDAMSNWGQASDVEDAKIGEKAIAPTALDGNLYRVPYTGSYVDFKLPNSLGNYKYVHVTVRGADGGNRTNNQVGLKVKGGGGATFSGFLKLGNANNEVSAGNTLRFIVGKKGDTHNSNRPEGTDGGAGTGLFLKGADNTWQTVMVAGGGGGAASDCCTRKFEGTSASTGPNGKEGGGTSHTGGNGGTGGGPGNNTSSAAGGGGINDAIKGGIPTGSVYTHHEIGYNFGCGYGGKSDAYASGAGGGGYSGGGAGVVGIRGGGGGSYYNEDISSVAVRGIANEHTNNPIDGYIEFQFITTDFPSTRIKAMNNQGFCIGTPSVQSNALMLVNCEVPTYRRYWILKDDLLNLNISGKCLVKNQSNDNAELGNCITSDFRKWTYDGVDQEIRSIENNEKCLARDDLYLKVETCNNSENQKWGIDGATSNLNEQKVASIRPYFYQSNCIDNNGGKTTNRNKIQIWKCGGTDGNDNQKWFFDGDYIRLSNHRGKCLHLPSTSNGTDLQLYTCTESSAQQWIYDGFNKVIRSKSNSAKCIDLTNGGTTNGTVVQIWDCQTDNSNMQWTLTQATPNPENEVFGAIKLTSSSDSDKKCIDLKNTNISNGANIQLYDCNGEAAQTWYIEGDQIRIIGRDNYCLSLASGDAHDGDDVHIWECKGQDNQAWIYDMTFKLIRSRIDANKCLAVKDNNIQLATCNYDATVKVNQQWTLPGGYAERVNGKNLKIHLGKDDEKCVDMDSGSSGADVRVYECKYGSDATAQTFYFDGSRIRRADNHSLCLELEDAKTDAGTDIQLGTCTGSISSQKWMYDGISGRIHSKADPNKCMRFTNGSTSNYTNIKLSECDEAQAEIFVIK